MSSIEQSLKPNVLNIDEDILIEEDRSHTEPTLEEADQVVSGAWTEDSSVPPGWQYRRVPVSRKVLVKDSQGKKFDGRRNAILHLIKTNQDLQNIEILDQGLEMEEDWTTNQHLPAGWKFKKSRKCKPQYLTNSYEIFTSHSSALTFVKNNLDNETIGRMQQWVENFSKSHKLSSSSYSFNDSNISNISTNSSFDDSNISDISYISSNDSSNTTTPTVSPPDETVPPGWRSRDLASAGVSLIISPCGREFTSRVAGLRFLLESEAPDQAVEDMRQLLHYEQWEESPSLPAGWRLRPEEGKVRLLTERGQMLDSFTEAFSHLRGRPAEARSEPTVPPGWSCSVEGKITYITAPDGTAFRSRRSALENMLSSRKYPREEVELMKRFLRFENWTESSDLPPGWRIRRKKNHVFLMGNDGKLFESFSEAAEFVNRYSRYYSQEDVQKIIKLCCSRLVTSGKSSQKKSKRRSRNRNPDQSWLPGDHTVPQGWLQKTVQFGQSKAQRLLSSDGQIFQGKRSALEHMIKNNYPEEKITEMRGLLKYDGWKSHQDLPQGWSYKMSTHRIRFCSSEGNYFNSREKALQVLKSRGENTKYDMLKSFLVSDQQQKQPIRRRNSEDCWSKDETLPRGWKSAISKDSKTRVLDPQGNCFRFRRQALKHLIDTNGSEEDIATLRESLKSEGWMDHGDRLPNLWLFKTEKFSRQLKFVTERGELVLNKIRAKTYLEKHSLNAEEDIKKIEDFKFNTKHAKKITKERLASGKHGRLQRERKFVPDDSWTSHDSVPEGWRQKKVKMMGLSRTFQWLLSPDGHKLKGKRSALEHMVKNNYPTEKIQEMRGLLQEDGWSLHPDLPDSWMYRMSATHTFLCSPEGKNFSREKAAKYAESQGKTEDVQKLKCFNVKNSEKKASKSLALDESSTFDETDSSFAEASNDESEESFQKSEEENDDENDCIITDSDDDEEEEEENDNDNDDIVLD